jgi:predicted RNA binding protein YcfA (HicA-like mRNA interferase family)
LSSTARLKGSQEIWYNPVTKRRTTVPHQPGSLPLGTLRAIIRQTGLRVDEFLEREH